MGFLSIFCNAVSQKFLNWLVIRFLQYCLNFAPLFMLRYISYFCASTFVTQVLKPQSCNFNNSEYVCLTIIFGARFCSIFKKHIALICADMLGGIFPLSPTTIMLLVVDFTFRTHRIYQQNTLSMLIYTHIVNHVAVWVFAHGKRNLPFKLQEDRATSECVTFHVHSYVYIYIYIYMIYICNKVNIWNVNCAWATALIFDSRTDVLVKVSRF